MFGLIIGLICGERDNRGKVTRRLIRKKFRWPRRKKVVNSPLLVIDNGTAGGKIYVTSRAKQVRYENTNFVRCAYGFSFAPFSKRTAPWTRPKTAEETNPLSVRR